MLRLLWLSGWFSAAWVTHEAGQLTAWSLLVSNCLHCWLPDRSTASTRDHPLSMYLSWPLTGPHSENITGLQVTLKNILLVSQQSARVEAPWLWPVQRLIRDWAERCTAQCTVCTVYSTVCTARARAENDHPRPRPLLHAAAKGGPRNSDTHHGTEAEYGREMYSGNLNPSFLLATRRGEHKYRL